MKTFAKKCIQKYLNFGLKHPMLFSLCTFTLVVLWLLLATFLLASSDGTSFEVFGKIYFYVIALPVALLLFLLAGESSSAGILTSSYEQRWLNKILNFLSEDSSNEVKHG